MKNLIFLLSILLLTGCDLVERDSSEQNSPDSGTKNTGVLDETKDTLAPSNKSDSTQLNSSIDSVQDISVKESPIESVDVSILDVEGEFQYVDERKLANGIKINWIERKKGRMLQEGEMILIEYRLSLPDGKIIDGNNKMKMPHLPFVIGYNMQQKGWDFAFSQMCVGDVAKIKIPSALAYGKKGLGTVIPPNTDNWLYVKIHGLVAPDYNEGGIRYWELRSGENLNSSNSKIKFHMIASTKNKANIFNTYASDFPLTYTSGQKNYPKGLEQVLKKAKKEQHLFIILKPEMAYGDKGYVDLIKPNESVFYNLKIIDTE